VPFGCPFTHGLAFFINFCCIARGDIWPSFDIATANTPDTDPQATEVPVFMAREAGLVIPEGNVDNQM